jgi:hypothetical protein
MSASEPFQVARLIISFEIVDPETGKIIGEFDPPFELQVGYTPKHWESAVEGGASHPRLAFWDFEPPEKDQQWIEFTVEKHNFRVEGDDQGGFLVATISNWGDPAYGAGP